MKRWLAAFLLGALGCQLAAQAAGQSPSPTTVDEISCRVCHPGATRGLRDTPHASLLDKPEFAGKVCSSCHGDLSSHAQAAGQRITPLPIVPKVPAASCTACHAGRDLVPASAMHALQVAGSGARPLAMPDADRLQALQQSEQDAHLAWSGFAELGYRLVHRAGSREAFETDVDLDAGPLLRDFELRGTGSSAAPLTDAALRAHDLGDPRWDADLSLRKTEHFAFDSRYQRARFLHDTSSDFHRVDRDSAHWTTTASYELGSGWQLFGSHTHRDEDGFWLTQRIGNRNLPVQTVVDGVASPRQLRSDEGELGLRGETADWHWTLAAGWLDEHGVDRWSFAQPATANPGFVESEDLRAASDLGGPVGRVRLERTFGDLTFELTGQVRELRRNLDSDGTGTGFDTAEFTTVTTARGRGRSRLFLGQADITWTLVDELRLCLDASWRDYTETHHLRQTDVRTTPSVGSVVAANTVIDDETVQRLADGECRLEWSPITDFDLAIGYGLADEQLRVPALQPADPLDFRRGHSRDQGPLASLRWRFAEQWTLRADGRDFAQDGVALHELVPERTRLLGGSVAWQREAGHATVFARHRKNENDVSAHRLDSFATGLHGGISTDVLSLDAGYTFARTESRTLTNFYFDPDPAPQPTLVGFDGETHTWSLSLVGRPCELLRAELTSAWTETTGSFDVSTFDLRADVQWRWTASGASGIEWRHLRYDDQHGIDDWQADLVFVYWRQEW